MPPTLFEATPDVMRWLIPAVLALAMTACSFSMPSFKLPRVHKITIQQGNVITQEMVDRLKPGMTPSQVVFIMGEPVLKNPFNEGRWDYVYTIEIPGVTEAEQRMSLFFENGVLASFNGNFVPSDAVTDDPVEEEDLIPDLPESPNESDAS